MRRISHFRYESHARPLSSCCVCLAFEAQLDRQTDVYERIVIKLITYGAAFTFRLYPYHCAVCTGCSESNTVMGFQCNQVDVSWRGEL